MRHGSGGEFLVEQSSGGLTTALSHTHAEMDSLWIGWPGGHFKAGEPRKRMQQWLRHEHRCVPVFLSGQAIQRYYYGFSNRALWPLFHSFQSYLVYNEEEWEAYVNAKRVFCDAVWQEAQSNDLIWGQDYHLFLLPDMLRQHLPDARIGLVLHTPFPSSEMFRVLPYWEAILRGLLGADLIGFQTFSYMQNFLWAVYRVLGIDAETGSLPHGGRQVEFNVWAEKFLAALQNMQHLQRTRLLNATERQRLLVAYTSARMLAGTGLQVQNGNTIIHRDKMGRHS
jgi:trehalose 6-phosphate synthase/phosphatase